MRRVLPRGGAIALAALAAAALAIAHARPEESLANGSGGALALEALAAASLIAAGSVARPTRAGLLLLASAAAFIAQVLPLPQAGGSLLFGFALALGAAAASFGAASVLALDGRAPRTVTFLAAGTVATCTVWLGLVPAALFDPRATGCFGCPRNVLLVHGSESLRVHVLHSGLRVAAVLSVVFAVALLFEKGRRHWTQWAAAAGASGALLASAFSFWHQATARVATIDRPVRLAFIVGCAALTTLAAAPLAEMLRARLERARIVDAVLRTVPSPDELRAAFASAAGDRSLALVYPHAGGAVDGEGRRAPAPSNGTVATDVARAGVVIAQLRHHELGSHAARRLADAVRAAGLALEHTSARARLRAQLADLTASRARIVEVADAERRRLERNLHDGAQQRLIALSVALASPADSLAVDARVEVLAALDELRAIAHGIHPVSLSDSGIVASVRELAETSSVPLRLELRSLDRLPARIESAVYRVVAACVHVAEQSGDGRPLTVELEMTDRGLDAEVRLPGVTRASAEGELAHAIDRVTAVGGQVLVSQGTDEAVVELRL